MEKVRRRMRTRWTSLFPPFKGGKSVSERRNNENRSPGRRDRRWPPGRRRKGREARADDEEDSEERGRRLRPGAPAPAPAPALFELLVVLVLVASARAICPSKCVCNDKVLEAACEHSNLEVVPIQLNPDIKTLKLSNNKIGSVHLTFIFYKNLMELDLSRNKIKSLGSKNFEFQGNLLKLNASYNGIRSLRRDTFRGLDNLLVLDLAGNDIEEIGDRMAFGDLRSLRELDLSRNNMYVVEAGVFDHLADLRRLILSENQLMRIPENAVDSLGKLVEIDLDLNLIEELSFLSSMDSLEVLKVRSNLIGSLSNETFDNLPRLRKLDLSDNNFTRIPGFQFSKLSYLEFLNLSSNLFEYLGPDSFRNLYKLREIYINGGPSLWKIDSKAFAENANLNYVSLSNNPNLRRLPKFLFLNKPNLKHVRISGNRFSTLDASDLPLDQLETLTLGRNPFTCNCSLHWLWILKERQTLRNCTCPDASCHDACAENLPEADELRDYRSDEDDDESSESEERHRPEETNSRFRGFAFDKDVFPIILDLDEIYCEGRQHSDRLLLARAPESDFDCTATWLLVLTALLLALFFLFLLAAFVCVLAVRCKRKPDNPVESFISAAKNYEDTHRTYYRYGDAVHNGDVFEVLKSARRKTAPDACLESPADRRPCAYACGPRPLPLPLPHPLTRPRPPHAPAPAPAHGPPAFFTDSSPPDAHRARAHPNIYQQPFASPLPPKNQRPPHIVYV